MVSTEGLVALHLRTSGGWAADATAPRAATTSGIAAALGVDEVLSARVELLSTLSEMSERGLLRDRETDVEDLSGDRTAYELTDAGSDLAASTRADLADTTVAVDDGGRSETLPLPDAAARLPETSLVELGRRVALDGVRRVGEGSGDDLVSRAEPKERVRATLDAVADGETRVAFVTGPAGIGKTALVEYARRRASERGMLVLDGAGRADAGEPYRPFRTALAERRERFRPLFDRGPASLELDDDVSERRRSLFYEVEAGLAELAAETPVVLAVDDLHAADRGSLELFAHLADAVTDLPVCLLGAYRTVESAADPLAPVRDRLDGVPVDRLDLGPLDADGTTGLVERLLDDPGVPASFVETIHERTGGTPLFVEESVAALRAEGTIDPTYGHYPDDAELPVPDRVDAVINRRVQGLDPEVREVLEYGAVVGSPIPFDVLAAATGRSEPGLREYVDVLCDGTIWRRVAGGDSVAFESDVVRDVILDGIAEARATGLHRTVAEAFLDVYGTETSSQAGRIARHFRAAGDPDRAIDHARTAGERAIDAFAHELALEHFETALVLARDADDETAVAELLERIGYVHATRGEYEAADRRYDYVLDRTDDPALRRRIAVERATMRRNNGDVEDSVAIASAALEDWDGERADPDVCRLLSIEGWARQTLGDQAVARERYERSLAMASELDDAELQSRALHRLGTLENFLGDVETAIEYLTAASKAAGDVGAIEREADSVNNLGMIHLKRGDLATTRDHFERSRRLYRTAGNRIRELVTVGNLGYCELKTGNWDRAVDHAEQCIEMADSLDVRTSAAFGNRLLGVVATHRGDVGTAREHLGRSLDTRTETGERRFVSVVSSKLARVDRLAGRWETALNHARRARTAATGVDTQWRARANAELGAIYRCQGHLPTARACYERGLELATDAENADTEVRTRLGIALVALEANRPQRAHEAAATALGTARTTQLPRLVVRARTVYGRVLAARDAHVVAERVLRDARAGADSLGATVDRVRIDLALGTVQWVRGERAAGEARIGEARDCATACGLTPLAADCRARLRSFAPPDDVPTRLDDGTRRTADSRGP